MSIISKTLAVALAVSTLGIAVASTSTSAAAHGHGMGGHGHFGGHGLNGGGHVVHPPGGGAGRGRIGRAPGHGIGGHFAYGHYGYSHYRYGGFYGSRHQYFGGNGGGYAAPVVGVRTCPAETHLGTMGKYCWPDRAQVSEASAARPEAVPKGAVLPTVTTGKSEK